MAKKNKVKFSKRTKILFISVCVVALVMGVLFIIVDKSMSKTSVEYLQMKTNEFLDEYSNSAIMLDVLTTSEEGDMYKIQYLLSAVKDTIDYTYIARDSEGSSIYQCWTYDEVSGQYKLYIHDTVKDVWVECYLYESPLSINPWNITADWSKYSLLEEKSIWAGTEDECYVLYSIVDSGEGSYEYLYEELYIRCSDYAPMGIINYAAESLDVTRVQEIEDSVFSTGYDIDENTTLEAAGFNECIQRYEFTFSKESLAFFETPDNFLTEEEYLSLIEEESSNE